MCGRYTSKKNPVEIAEEFEATNRIAAERNPDFNVAPTRMVPVVRAEKPREDPDGPPAAASGDDGAPRETAATGRELVEMKWGLVPFWAKDPKTGGRMFNARVESVAGKPAFRRALKKRRCIVPADGYYEWKKLDDGTKQPYYMTAQDGSSLAFAGLWELWGEGDDRLTTFTIITTAAAGHLEEIHDRMPFLLPSAAWTRWLDPAQEDVADLLEHPDLARAEALELRPVGAEVGKVANNGPDLIRRIEPDAVLF
ncbi:SOS response-associated peptidase [Cumulibacter manganitolerans]|uniref:SOS response-associated peptidase n=1 Tax=Cumulibacter manganitolerans TaxID=1884992 RepID=UPI0012965936|nr:SOS response-associated peptidase [Cumulibacter manganitolerans]